MLGAHSLNIQKKIQSAQGDAFNLLQDFDLTREEVFCATLSYHSLYLNTSVAMGKIPNVIGIENLGNSCFMGSILQILAHTQHIREIVAQHTCSQTFCLPCMLQPLLKAMEDEHSDVFSPNDLYASLPAFLLEYAPGDQYDASEFFENFINQMQKSESTTRELFQSNFTKEAQCVHCESASKGNAEHLVIATTVKGKETVTKVIQNFLQSKSLSHCSPSGKNSDFIQKYHFEKMPQILSILVSKGKSSSLIYENELHIKDHLGKSHAYSLYGAVIHIAYGSGGHYFSLIRRENRWIEFDDSKVKYVEKLRHGGKGNILFYQKVMRQREIIIVKGKRTPKIGKKAKSSWEKVMQKSEDLKVEQRRSSRIAQKATSSSRKVPSSPVVSKGRVDIPNSFKDDFLDDCENVTVPIATPSPSIAIEQRPIIDSSSQIPSDTPFTKESRNGASEGSARVTGHLVVSDGVDIVGDVPNMELATAETLVGLTFGMNIEVPVDATIVAASQVAPVPAFFDSLTLNSSGEHIEAFLDRFEQDRYNEHEASHFYNFVGLCTSIHRFSVPSESISLLEHLRARHNDFIEQLTVGSIVCNHLLRILAAVLMDMQETQVTALTKKRLFEWRDAVRDLHKAGLEVSFVLRHLREVATSWLRRNVKARLASIAQRISELEAELTMLKSEMVQLQRDVPDAIILDNNAIHGLL